MTVAAPTIRLRGSAVILSAAKELPICGNSFPNPVSSFDYLKNCPANFNIFTCRSFLAKHHENQYKIS